MITPRRYRRRITLISAALGLFVLYHFFSFGSDSQPSVLEDANHRSICPPLPGIEDVLVVMKTGVTEALDKVPVHFQTTLRCIPNYVIFSDYEEVVGGVRIYDALRNMDSQVKRNIPDFNIYNRIQELGRDGLKTDDFADEANTNLGKPNNPGWKLDKWKFLPMVQETLRYKDDAKWYVFIEADTYVSWTNLLEWLALFNPEEPHYIGTETQIADVVFAHGGSGFIVSQPALEKASHEYATRTIELNDYTNGHWAGDCVLGKVLHDAGVPLYFSWPMLQNTNLGELDEFTVDFYRRPWCFPAVAFHHLSSMDIQDLWEFEQHRWQEYNKTILLHGEIFEERIYPELSPRRPNWDNLSGDEQPSITTLEDCQKFCNRSADCAQFTFKYDQCFTSKTPKLGKKSPGMTSGWSMATVENMMDKAPSCIGPDFGR
ncbi:hypothetical protein ASPWEDRAFT_52409 [Aspergillus wentii DTO 134E9]|uniref:N-acetylgalactosaminide beta-1,3-galactosyltransferase n=1 Tax=Aspergillus wentii DTO 134E9 TaxID=1073089 RepID=A0A1L9RGQ3_ASPWE|nr:uncharacterized protein ASPWEDRAFT_52409 [Aspergillus wentii DTO 134E9]KAI9927884.1 hypothetical protein MW887_002736 [Aspergillus wentii]OJJ34105.1 hypothetical protein ASPWEDRAFT_52409 [Aspergillus wentii DTO 134E9]